MVCPSCGAQTDPAQQYCLHCGFELYPGGGAGYANDPWHGQRSAPPASAPPGAWGNQPSYPVSAPAGYPPAGGYQGHPQQYAQGYQQPGYDRGYEQAYPAGYDQGYAGGYDQGYPADYQAPAYPQEDYDRRPARRQQYRERQYDDEYDDEYDDDEERGSRWPSFLLAALLLLVMVGGGYYVAKRAGFIGGDGGGGNTPASQSTPTTKASTSASPSAKASTGTGATTAKDQAGVIDALLSDSASSRSKLSPALNDVAACSGVAAAVDVIDQVTQERTDQVGRAKAVAVDKLDGGDALKAKLVAMLSDSLKADQAYGQWADAVKANGCGAGKTFKSSGDAASGDAQADKSAFVKLWNPIATDQGFKTRDVSEV
jgi:hypothetical protein